MTPIRTGIALAITVAVFYALCALVWFLAPGPFLGFMNSLFHGMDFNSMVQPRPFGWQGFLTALLVLSTWALLAGTFFAWLLNRMTR
ncbi:MAG: hypothetical protein HYX42_19710 [Polaromonas sp.]|uniref:DUF5676 family membrane protein n=1 Tax=Polaromonas sp. TaxID=1869339 RepID=UPI0025F2C8D8|nr:DUF5676 family membrane protein [Polaromonas sp.]MBI2728470.1 hypothetical protein [Polaromonas sp.]